MQYRCRRGICTEGGQALGIGLGFRVFRVFRGFRVFRVFRV